MGEVKESCRGFVLVQVWSVSWSHASPSPLCWALCKTCLLLQLRGDVIKSYLNAFSFSILQAIWAVILKGRFSAPPHSPPPHHHPHGIDPGWSWEARAPPPPRGVDPPRGTGERGCRLRACVRACVQLRCSGPRPTVEMQASSSHPLLLVLSVLFLLEGFFLFSLRNTLNYFFFLRKRYISLW